MNDCTFTWTDLSPDGPIHLCHERNAALDIAAGVVRGEGR